ncbi:MAG: hypothetical protein EXR76_06955 [Myxococcales bacterium]|nr:hypothetical protein [Myxococcales bacterium]
MWINGRLLALGAVSIVSLFIVGCDAKSPPATPSDLGGAAGADGSDGASDGAGPPACEPGERRCSDAALPEICREGAFESDDPCPPSQSCTDGACNTIQVCLPDETRCASADVLEVCNADGTGFISSPCPSGCIEDNGAAICTAEVCTADEKRCSGDQIVVKCRADGRGFEFSENCSGANTARTCDRGVCTPICELSEKVKSNIGCDYWAVDLDNAFVPGGETGFLDAAAEQFSVVVSNPHPQFTGEVSVFMWEGGPDPQFVESAVVPPLGLQVFNLPRRDVDGTIIAMRAFRVQSSIPIVAYQFNPLENEGVFSNDASLLLPSHVLGDEYYIMTREQSFDRLRGYLTVVGIDPDRPTSVSVTVTAPTRPGVGNIPALMPGETFTAELRQFEVLNIETNAPGADLTGSHVVADGDVVVFGGSEAANAPNTNHCVEVNAATGLGVCEYKRDVPCRDNYSCNDARLNTCCADHLEEQLFPVDTLGKNYVATKSFDRGLEHDYWRILAVNDDTKVETVPPQAAIPVLGRGQWFEFGSREHFEIISDKPIMVGQFLASEQAPEPNLRNAVEPGDASTGDPSMIMAVPINQFREDFVFLAPDKYAFDYVSIIAPVAANVDFDNDILPVPWEPVGDGLTWQIARFPIGDGVHFILSDLPVSVIVYGYDQYVSYGYPGGLNLNVVDPETGEEVR